MSLFYCKKKVTFSLQLFNNNRQQNRKMRILYLKVKIINKYKIHSQIQRTLFLETIIQTKILGNVEDITNINNIH